MHILSRAVTAALLACAALGATGNRAAAQGAPPAPTVGVTEVTVAAGHLAQPVCRPHPGSGQRGPGRPRDRLPRAAAVHRGGRRQEGAVAVCPGAGTVPGPGARPAGQPRGGAGQRHQRLGKLPAPEGSAEHPGRPEAGIRQRACHGPRQCGQRVDRARQPAGGADQPRLYRDPRAGRWPHHPDGRQRRQRGQPDQRHAGDHRYPGSDVRRVPGGDPRRGDAAEEVRCARRPGVRKGAPGADQRRHVRPRRQARLRGADGLDHNRHHHASCHHRQSGARWRRPGRRRLAAAGQRRVRDGADHRSASGDVPDRAECRGISRTSRATTSSRSMRRTRRTAPT